VSDAHLFSVTMKPTGNPDFPYRWFVVCDVCGVDLGGQFEAPVTILNVKGNIPQAEFQQFKRALFNATTSPHRTLVMNSREDVQVIPVGGDLQLVMIEHVEKCGKIGATGGCEHLSLKPLTRQTCMCEDCEMEMPITCNKPNCKRSMIHTGACDIEMGRS
jgi:hypothetical protein